MSDKTPIICDEQELKDSIHHIVENVFEENFDKRFEDVATKIISKIVWNWRTLGFMGLLLSSIAGSYYQIQKNSDYIQEGGRYSQEEADVDNKNAAQERENIRQELRTAVDNQNQKLDIIIRQTKY